MGQRARTILLAVAGGLLLAAPPASVADESEDWCREDGGYRERERHCEVRELRLPAREILEVDASPNGGISVVAEDRDDVMLLAKVVATGDTLNEARALAERVRLETQATILADGPASRRHASWWVSFRLLVPERSNLSLRAHNGGLSVEGVHGEVELRSLNGGVRLSDVGGRVRARTTNGGVKVALDGTEWNGEGLDVETTNGGVVIEIPEGYNARLETGTVNGGMRLGFPVTVQGRIDRELSVDLGRGGRTIRAVTTNGGVRVETR